MSTALDTEVPTDLPTLAREIGHYHGQARIGIQTALNNAREAGRRLLEAKKQVAHGKWLPWLREHFDGSRKTAAAYMRIAERWDELVADPNVTVTSHLSIDGALKVLANKSGEGNGGGRGLKTPGEKAWTACKALDTEEEQEELTRQWVEEHGAKALFWAWKNASSDVWDEFNPLWQEYLNGQPVPAAAGTDETI